MTRMSLSFCNFKVTFFVISWLKLEYEGYPRVSRPTSLFKLKLESQSFQVKPPGASLLSMTNNKCRSLFSA